MRFCDMEWADVADWWEGILKRHSWPMDDEERRRRAEARADAWIKEREAELRVKYPWRYQ